MQASSSRITVSTSSYVNLYTMAADASESTFHHLHESSKLVTYHLEKCTVPENCKILAKVHSYGGNIFVFVTCLYLHVKKQKVFSVKLISLLPIRVCIPQVIVFLVWDLCTDGVNKICFKQQMTALWGRKTAQLQHAARPEEVAQCETSDWQLFKSQCHKRDLRLSGYSNNTST